MKLQIVRIVRRLQFLQQVAVALAGTQRGCDTQSIQRIVVAGCCSNERLGQPRPVVKGFPCIVVEFGRPGPDLMELRLRKRRGTLVGQPFQAVREVDSHQAQHLLPDPVLPQLGTMPVQYMQHGARFGLGPQVGEFLVQRDARRRPAAQRAGEPPCRLTGIGDGLQKRVLRQQCKLCRPPQWGKGRLVTDPSQLRTRLGGPVRGQLQGLQELHPIPIRRAERERGECRLQRLVIAGAIGGEGVPCGIGMAAHTGRPSAAPGDALVASDQLSGEQRSQRLASLWRERAVVRELGQHAVDAPGAHQQRCVLRV